MSKFYISSQAWGNNLLVRGYENGIPFTDKVKYQPTLYIESKDTDSEWKTLYGSLPLEPVKFDSIHDMKEFVKTYESVNGFNIHGFQKSEYAWINANYKGDIDYNFSDVNILYYDIEIVGEESQKGFPDIQLAEIPVVLISLYGSKNKTATVLGLKEYDNSNDDFEYIKFESEKDLLKYFILYNQINGFDVWSGYNIEEFDTPYIVNRIQILFGEDMVKKLSPFNIVKEVTIEIRGKEVLTYDIYGIVSLDMLQLYKRYGTYSAKESYALGYISQEELGETKVELEGNSFYDNYHNFTNNFIKYSMVDTILVQKLDAKMQLIQLAFSIAFLYKCNLKDIYRTVVPWEVFIFNHLAKSNIAYPPRSKNEVGSVVGGWVKDPVIKMHSWVMTLDFKSLYPSVIRQWNISPECFHPAKIAFTLEDVLNGTDNFKSACEYAKDHGLSLCANGTLYNTNSQGFLPEMMAQLGTGRDAAKRQMILLEKEHQAVLTEINRR